MLRQEIDLSQMRELFTTCTQNKDNNKQNKDDDAHANGGHCYRKSLKSLVCECVCVLCAR